MTAWPDATEKGDVREGGGTQPFGLILLFYQRDPAYALGLASLSAYVKREIGDVRVHLVPVLHGDDPRHVVRLVRDLGPDLLGVSAMSPTWLPTDPYLCALRAELPGTPVVVGGYQAIVSPEETLAHPAVDYVCVGDGEEPLVGLIRRLRGEASADAPITGLWEVDADGTVVRTPPALVQDLASLPFPDYTIFARDGSLAYLSPRAIQSPSLVTVPVLSGRGCPYRCTYCANTTLLDLYGAKGGFLRKFDPGVLVEELARLRDRYGVEYLQFWDEEFLYDLRYARALLPRYRERVGLPFSMFARAENMSPELCALAAQAGCHSMWFGLESGSEAYRRKYLQRRMSNRVLLDAAAVARRHGIKLFCFNMVGLPFETRDDVRATLELSRAIAPELTVFSQYLPLPGTPLYDLCRLHDLLLPPSCERQMWPLGELNVRPHDGGLTPDEMREVADEVMAYLRDFNRCEP